MFKAVTDPTDANLLHEAGLLWYWRGSVGRGYDSDEDQRGWVLRVGEYARSPPSNFTALLAAGDYAVYIEE